MNRTVRKGEALSFEQGMLHEWHIEEREYARQEQRRGRRHGYQNLDPTRTALVVIDMVPFFVNDNPYCRGIVPNIVSVAEALRDAGGTIAWVLPGAGVRPASEAEFLGPQVAEMFLHSGGVGPLVDRLWHGFDVHQDDLLVEKTASSAFFRAAAHCRDCCRPATPQPY